VKWRVDASGEGCSGMFWRTEPNMGSISKSADWPRNGTIVTGVTDAANPGWVKLDNGYWLPLVQNNVKIMHEVAQ